MNEELDRPKKKKKKTDSKEKKNKKRISRFIRLHLDSSTYAEKMLPGERQVEKKAKKI